MGVLEEMIPLFIYILNFYMESHLELKHFAIKTQMVRGKLQIGNCTNYMHEQIKSNQASRGGEKEEWRGECFQPLEG